MACHCELKEEPHRKDSGTIIYWLRKIIPSRQAEEVEIRGDRLYFRGYLVAEVSFAEVIIGGDKEEKSVFTPIFIFHGYFRDIGYDVNQLHFWVKQHLHMVASEVREDIFRKQVTGD